MTQPRAEHDSLYDVSVLSQQGGADAPPAPSPLEPLQERVSSASAAIAQRRQVFQPLPKETASGLAEQQAELLAQQHQKFQQLHPEFVPLPKKNPKKEPIYQDMACGMSIGPLHRARAHVETEVHRKVMAKLQETIDPPLGIHPSLLAALLLTDHKGHLTPEQEAELIRILAAGEINQDERLSSLAQLASIRQALSVANKGALPSAAQAPIAAKESDLPTFLERGRATLIRKLKEDEALIAFLRLSERGQLEIVRGLIESGQLSNPSGDLSEEILSICRT